MTVYVPPQFYGVAEDNLVRKDSTSRPTPGSSRSSIGKSRHRHRGQQLAAHGRRQRALLAMSEEQGARRSGHELLGYVKGYAFCRRRSAPSSSDGARCTRRRSRSTVPSLKLKDMDLIDMHEAFAAQVLSNTQALERQVRARQARSRRRRVGLIDWDQVQRERRLDLDRPPVRRDRGSPDHPDPAGAQATKRAVRPCAPRAPPAGWALR